MEIVTGNRVVVAGAGQGLGTAVVKGVVDEGARVLAADVAHHPALHSPNTDTTHIVCL
jgi:NAD(P)-dependent dehydrogenase (short-subunit alcohol dehydrogenase family)